jgi:hypothetical protein
MEERGEVGESVEEQHPRGPPLPRGESERVFRGRASSHRNADMNLMDIPECRMEDTNHETKLASQTLPKVLTTLCIGIVWTDVNRRRHFFSARDRPHVARDAIGKSPSENGIVPIRA